MAKNLKRDDVLHACTRRIKPIRPEALSSVADITAALDAIHRALPDVRTVTLLKEALLTGCVSQSDCLAILGTPIQFIQIGDDCLLPAMEADRIGLGHRRMESRYLDVLLFVAELHNPRIDRLRVARRHYDIVMESGGYDTRVGKTFAGKYTQSPAPLIPPMVERVFYNSQQALEDASETQSEVPMKYWAFSPAIEPKTSHEHWLLAFDDRLEYIPSSALASIIRKSQSGRTILRAVRGRSRRWSKRTPVITDSELISSIKETIYYMCGRRGLSMAGTPFTNPPAHCLHVLAKRIVVSADPEYVTAWIPRSFVANHLETLIVEDFSDLDMMMGRHKASIIPHQTDSPLPYELRQLASLSEQDRLRIAKPRPNDNVLTEGEIMMAVQLAWQVMTRSLGLSDFSSYEYVTQIVYPWWRGEETLERKLKHFLTDDIPDKTFTIRTDDDILQAVTDTLGKATDEKSGDRQYFWARFCRERAKVSTNARKVRSAGRRGKYKTP